MTSASKISVGLVDDHKLFRDGLLEIINSFEEYNVVLEADNGKQLISLINRENLPSIILLDINMPVMDGYETAEYLNSNYPKCKILALSMYDSELAIIKMLKTGVKGYILKDIRKHELKDALDSVINKGFYYTDLLTNKLINNIGRGGSDSEEIDKTEETLSIEGLNENLMKFLKLSCSELTYKEIADKMYLSVHTIDGYRNTLFEKFNVKSRTGLVLFALKRGVVQL